MSRRAALYLRISMDRSGEGLGVGRQREDTTALVARNGWTLVGEYCDNDVSASTTKRRPEYQRLLADIRQGRIDAVAVWSLDRLSRRPIEIEEFIDLADDHQLALASVGGEHDIATASGRLHMRIMAAVARDEVDRKSDRQRRQRRQAAESGRMSGAPRAFGYSEGGLHLDPNEAPLVRDAYARFLAGATLMSIAKRWNERGVRTPRGKTFRAQTVRTVLSNPRNAGIRGVRQLQPGKAGRSGARELWHTVVTTAVWPPIVDRETWEAVMVILKDPQRRTFHDHPNRKSSARYLLPFIATCGVCDAYLVTGSRTSKLRSTGERVQTRLLRCSSLQHVSRAAAPIEEFVQEVLLGALEDPRARAELHRQATGPTYDIGAIREQIATQRALRDQATEAWTDDPGGFTIHDLKVAHRRIDARLSELDEQLLAAVGSDPLLELAANDNPDELWASWPIEVKRTLLRSRLNVVVHPGSAGRPGGKRFDPASVTVSWRHTADS